MTRLVASLAGASAAAMVASAATPFTITFTNKCSSNIELYTRLASVYTDQHETIASGSSVDRAIGKNFEGHFRNGFSDAATLVEFSTVGELDITWHDLGIIPPRLVPDHKFCKSLADCKANSESGIGFNTPVQILPTSNTNGANCRALTCLADGCPDAYNFPQDDTKTHSCPFGTNFIVTFCPSGDSSPIQTSVSPNSTMQTATATNDTTQQTVGSLDTPYGAQTSEVGNEANFAGNPEQTDVELPVRTGPEAETSGAQTPEAVASGAETSGAGTPITETLDAETPGAQTPEAVTPEAVTPEAETPEAETPEAVTPEVVTPEAETPEAVTPEAVTPEAVASGAETSGAGTPITETLDAETPGAQTPEAVTPEAVTPEAETPEAETPEAVTPEAETPEAVTPDAVTPNAETPNVYGTLPATTPESKHC